jgi:hypothetical protein
MAVTTHPDEATPVCPSLRLRRIEGLEKIEKAKDIRQKLIKK